MGATIEYLGHSSFLLQSPGGTRVLIDPYLSEYRDAAVAPDDLENIDLVLVTHAAFDHLGDAIPIALRNRSRFVCGPDVNIRARQAGLTERVTVVVSGARVDVKDVSVKVLDARHISFSQLPDGTFLTGPALSYCVSLGNELKVYHSGDTSITRDLELFGELYKPDVVLVNVGSAEGYISEMSPHEAALAAKWLGARIAVPMHYVPGSGEPEEFRDFMAQMAPHAQVVIMKPGESLAPDRELKG